MTSIEALSSTLLANMTIEKLFIKNMSNCGCGDKFELIIFSSEFSQFKLRVQKHQRIQDILKDEIAKLHAISFKCYLPTEYDDKKAEIVEGFVDCSPKTE